MVNITVIETKEINSGPGNWVAEVGKREFFSERCFLWLYICMSGEACTSVFLPLDPLLRAKLKTKGFT